MKQWLGRLGTMRELLHFFWRERLWFLIPFILTLLVIALLIVFAQTSPVAPFLYTVF